MRWHLVILISSLVIGRAVAAPADGGAKQDPYVDKEFVILRSTPSFAEATKFAARAAATLGVGLNLRGLSPDLRTGLTFSRAECTRSEFPYPCYVPRGRWDDGTYVSVEWSSAYPPLAKGLYVVMMASGVPGAGKTRGALAAARRVYPDAYAKRLKVCVGCMH